MPAPLMCTNNTQGHVDYGIPLHIYKSTDYRTSTGTHHRFIPPKGQDFDARVNIRGFKELFKSDWNMKDINYNTNYNSEYTPKLSGSEPQDFSPFPLSYQKTHYVRTIQEHFFENPPPPMKPKVSEMKDNYLPYPVPPVPYREVNPPNPFAFCEIKGLGRDEQPPIRPEEKGYYRLLDPYLTTYRATHYNFPLSERSGIGEKNIITFYIGKGYNPVGAPPTEPLVPPQRDPVYDRLVFKTRIQNKIVRKQPPTVLEVAKKSTYGADYIKQSFSNLYPYLEQSGEERKYSYPEPGPWQNLCPPAMYCTENCHIGTGWPINAVVDPLAEDSPLKNPLKGHPYNPCCKKFNDAWF